MRCTEICYEFSYIMKNTTVEKFFSVETWLYLFIEILPRMKSFDGVFDEGFI